ncbi:MAG: hypothetical protein JNL28_01190 [Planctomycetes bacterium]|nr:hypothetical protein [Planctomycetota bacterium]
MKASTRKLLLTLHVAVSVGWLGAIGAYLALALAGLRSGDTVVVRSAYVAMEIIARFVIVPCALAATLTGIVQAAASNWGLFRHYWILAKLAVTLVATVILLAHMEAVSRMSELARTSMPGAGIMDQERLQLVLHAVGGLVVVLFATTLSIYKPWGLTPYGRRAQREVPRTEPILGLSSSTSTTPRWALIFGVHAVVLVLGGIVWHVLDGGMHGH